MRNFINWFMTVLLVAIVAMLSFGCIKTGEMSGAASVDNASLSSDVAPPGATDQPDPEVERLRAENAKLQIQASRSSSVQSDNRSEPAPQAAPPQAPPLRGIPIPGIAGGAPVGTGVIVDGNIQMLTFRPLITRPVFWVNVINATRPSQYLGIELTNGDDQLVPCNGKMGSWRPVRDNHTRQPVWILPPGSRACLTRPISNCPQSDDGNCNIVVREVHYSFSAPDAVRGYSKDVLLELSPSTPGRDMIVER